MAPLQYEIKQKSASPAPPQILDIQREKLALSLEGDILDGLIGKAENEKTLPTMLLYSAEGLKLYEDITYLDEYYLTNTEIELLEQDADEMAKRIHDGSIVLELGSGNLRKVNILLEALDRQGKQIDYYALDLDLSELKRTLDMAPHDKLKNVRLHGLHGTYEDGRAWLKTVPEIKDRPRCILWMGSSVGNCLPTEAAEFLKSFVGDALRPGKPDYMLIGVDGCKDPEKVYTAYNDPHGVTRQFIMSGLKNANRILDDQYFKQEEWEYLGEWNAELGRHQAYLLPKKDIEFGGRLKGVFLKKGERVNIEYSYKLDDGDAKKYLWEEAGLVEGAQWANASGNYSLNLLQRPAFWFPSTPELYAPGPVPSLSEWQELWTSWETVTLGMIPRNQLLSKPIDLRNPCIFYLGHIPTFLDHLLNLSTGYNPTSPASYLRIFQRGIDPDVDDPSLCHSHSEIPDTWPDLEEILDYQQRVRNRLRSLYRKGSVSHQPQDVKRAIFLAFEHEAMHLETLLYMLVQSDATLSPPNTIIPDFESAKATQWRGDLSKGNMWVDIPGMKFNVGMDDGEGEEEAFFGWDNEKPVQKYVEVQALKARAYPITNEEYLNYLDATGNDNIPASWKLGNPAAKVSIENGHANGNGTVNGSNGANGSTYGNRGELFVKTVYGAVPMKYALDWPVMASYDELSGCAAWMNARIPTANEVRAIYRHAEASDVSVEKKISTMIDAVNGHLVHNGVCESPPSNDLNAARSGLFAPLTNKNVGLRHWHPTSVRAQGGKLLGRGETGGAWEWTSTVLERHEDFMPEKFYPEYTADFFDGKHNIVLGGSWATHPRIAGRKTFVNWYQRNYPYVWATARIVKN